MGRCASRRLGRLRRLACWRSGRLVGSGIKLPNPLVYLLLDVLLEAAVAFLQFADELLPLAGDVLEVVVGQFPPLRFELSGQLIPTTFNLIPIHGVPAFVSEPSFA